MSFMDRLGIYSTNNDIRLLNSMNGKCHWNVIISTWVVVVWEVVFLRIHRNLCRTGAPLASVFFASLVFRGNPARFISPFTFVSRHLIFTHLRRVSFPPTASSRNIVELFGDPSFPVSGMQNTTYGTPVTGRLPSADKKFDATLRKKIADTRLCSVRSMIAVQSVNRQLFVQIIANKVQDNCFSSTPA